MTMREAIARADEIRPNTVGDETKAGWVHDLDGDFAETLQVAVPRNNWPDDRDLLMPHPADEVYPLYLCAMIDFAQQDMQQYQVDQAMYESARAQAAAWWRRTHRPRVTPCGARWYP